MDGVSQLVEFHTSLDRDSLIRTLDRLAGTNEHLAGYELKLYREPESDKGSEPASNREPGTGG